MKPEHLPGTAEKLVIALMAVGLLVGCTALIYGNSSHNFGSSLFLILGLPLFALSALAVWILSRSRLEAIRLDNWERAKASAELPVVLGLSVEDSILILRWSLDSESHSRISLSQANRALMLAFGSALLLLTAGLLCEAFVIGVHRGTMAGIRSLSFSGFLVGLFIVYLLFVVVVVRTTLRKQLREQYSETAIQHFCLVLDPDGMRLVTGKLVTTVPWIRIFQILEAHNSVFLSGWTWTQVIPSHAFRSAGDAKAFAATIRAMKRRKQHPAHNWSGYGLVEPSIEGVWPPAIR